MDRKERKRQRDDWKGLAMSYDASKKTAVFDPTRVATSHEGAVSVLRAMAGNLEHPFNGEACDALALIATDNADPFRDDQTYSGIRKMLSEMRSTGLPGGVVACRVERAIGPCVANHPNA